MVSQKQAYRPTDADIRVIRYDSVERQRIDAHIDYIVESVHEQPHCRRARFLVEFIQPGAEITPYALDKTRSLHRSLPSDCILIIAFVIAPGLLARLLNFLINSNPGNYPHIHAAIFESTESAAAWLRKVASDAYL